MFKIALVEPEIAPNTGNIARLCAATRCELHLIHPLGFILNDRNLKRAGLDYWSLVTIVEHNSLEQFMDQVYTEQAGFHLVTTKSQHNYNAGTYQPGDYLIFGPETRGLPAELIAKHPEHCLRIPMRQEARSLNLANSVAIIAYTALAQHNFPELV